MASEQLDSRDERIGRILNEYLDRTQRGDLTCERELLAANPDLADDLRDHFSLLHQVAPGGADVAPDPAQAARLQESLPGYEIVGEIHRGGQGVIYQAMQKATRRQVAIKVMREGPFAGWRDRVRFEREVQILGTLRHPSIVTIHDSGVAAGCHYFVMDYISGYSLDAWLAVESRPLSERLRVFVATCDAVNAAHVKGIIHRDLKPGNIRIDEDGQPHILDFGLATVSLGDRPGGAAGSMTVAGEFVGSLPWTSPEQAQGKLEQIDTRTDVYALGVILYQVLTGLFPYEVAGPMRDVLNRIVGEEPARPSALRAEVAGDLEAIVLKCLRKEPHLRYQNAGEVGRDIERYLWGEAVVARSESGLYVLRKTLRRYRIPLAVAGAFALLITVSLLASLSLWRQAVKDRDRADAQAVEAEQARQLAELERARAEDQAERQRRTSYLNRIALAQNACEQKSLTRARQLLEACQPDLRGWEWYRLQRLSRQPALMDVVADPACVVCIGLSPDGHRVFTGGCGGEIRSWDTQTGAAGPTFRGHAGQVNALSVSADGHWMASGGRDQSLRLWDLEAGSCQVLESGRQYVHAVAFSPDGMILAAGGQGRILAFYDVASRRVIRTTSAQEGEVSCIAISPDGRWVASGEFMNLFSAGSKVRVWEIASGNLVREFTGFPAGIRSIAFSPDGRRIAVGSGIAPAGTDAQGTLRLLDTGTGEEIFSLRGHEGFVDALAFSPDGLQFASAGSSRFATFGMEADRTLKIWSTATGAEVCTYSGHAGGARAVAWSPEGDRLYSGGMDGRVKAWPSTPPAEARVLRGHSGSIFRLAFSPDGLRLASCSGQAESDRPGMSSADNTIRVWEFATGSPLLTLSEHRNPVLGLAWSPSGKLIASGSVDRTVRTWDAVTGRPLLTFDLPEAVQSVAFSPDNSVLAANTGSTTTLWGLSDQQPRLQIPSSEALRGLAFSPDGRCMAIASIDGVLAIWDWRTGEQQRQLATAAGLNGVWFSPDSTIIATAHVDGSILLWDASSSAKLAVLAGPPRPVQNLDFSPDGRRIVSCATDMMLRLWDVRMASEVYTFPAANAPLTCARFSPDGLSIATSSQDNLVRIWEGQRRAE